MRGLIASILSVFITSGAFAATASRALPSSNSVSGDASTATTSRGNIDASRSAISRTAVRTDTTVSDANVSVSRGAVNGANAVAAPSRGTAVRGATANVSATRDGLDAAVHTVGRNARVSSASINNTAPVRRAGLTLRPSTAEVGGRATIGDTDIQTGSNVGNSVRALQSRAGTTNQRETISEAKERLEQTAELNKSCQEQYNDCMDQFCAVVDSNQKRCSCSANLAQYQKVESAVKDANNQLNEVAQRIRYIGLSADEISAIMSATEAEAALSNSADTSETRSMLDDIAALIKDPKTSTNTSGGTDSFSTLDLDLDFSDSSDLFSLDFLNNNSTSSISNMRGTALYNAAKKRCNSILTQCKDAGGTSAQITSNYDLAIDKDCIAYEKGLTKMNETLVSNVRSANLLLQKARLAVLQNKNEYDAKGCIAALDECMTDDMVCGENYEKCLDPTKKYIDENGKVVLGADVTKIRDLMYNYDNSQISKDSLKKYTGITNCMPTQKQCTITGRDTAIIDGKVAYANCEDVNGGQCSNNTNTICKSVGDGSCTVAYLMQKIGTGQKVTDGGLCRAVLDKCQRYTYDSKGEYNPYNDVVVNYIQRAMVNIKAGQEKIISDYASTCLQDVATCYNQQVSQINAWTTVASAGSIKNILNGACRNVALTCGMAIYDYNICKMDGKYNQPSCYIEEVSKIFYQSMLCPENSEYVSVSHAGALEYVEKISNNTECTGTLVAVPGVVTECVTKPVAWQTVYNGRAPSAIVNAAAGSEVTGDVVNSSYVNDYCVCLDGYRVLGNSCVPECTSENDSGKGRTCWWQDS